MKTFLTFTMVLMALLSSMACREEKRYHDLMERRVQDTAEAAVREILKFQRELNASFRDPETSPLSEKQRKTFAGLEFFNANSAYTVVAHLRRTPDALPFLMPTTTERKSKEVVYGIARFSLFGKYYELEIYQNQDLMLQDDYHDYLFLPFLDLTNGRETYAGGRYIDLSIPKGDSLIIDFNQAYNPYCVYNPKYSCPIVPKVNSLNLEILAGVKDFGSK